jgi:hypothetical protein
MWGLNWGQMIWGQAVPVPTLGFWGLIVLAAVLGALGVRRLRGGRPRLAGGLALGLALLVPISARALPFTFTNGTVADATQVNANFAALAGAQAVGPTASSDIVDLFTGGSCPTGGVALSFRSGPDGVATSFSISAGQTLVVTSVNAQITPIPSSPTFLRVQRNGPSGFSVLDSVGVGPGPATSAVNIALTYPTGSAFGPGTQLCLYTLGTVVFGSAHGYLTTQ